MNNEIIKDYGKTVTPKHYINALQGHQYIPQADQCIKNIVEKFGASISGDWALLDVGCGPGRLTFNFVNKIAYPSVYGIDISASFIKEAQNRAFWREDLKFVVPQFVSADFKDIEVYLPNECKKGFDCLVMQGVMHHIRGEDRVQFFKRSFDLLKEDGILIIGDEFIKEYESEEERVMNVAKFYLHIIDEARKGGFDELAEEEAKNLIDDCLSGTQYAGYATGETFRIIYKCAKETNGSFYRSGCRSLEPSTYLVSSDIATILINQIKGSIQHLVESSSEGNFNRGDYKVSIRVFEEEAVKYGFKLKEKYKIGPVDQLGGMGVLVFQKS